MYSIYIYLIFTYIFNKTYDFHTHTIEKHFSKHNFFVVLSWVPVMLENLDVQYVTAPELYNSTRAQAQTRLISTARMFRY
jgi:hypothetical protein